MKSVLDTILSTPTTYNDTNNRTCRECCVAFPDILELRMHFAKQHPSAFTCSVCFKSATSSLALKRHRVITHPDCKNCKKPFDTPFSYFWHTQHYHSSKAKKRVSSGVQNTSVWYCRSCSFIFLSKASCGVHEHLIHGLSLN